MRFPQVMIRWLAVLLLATAVPAAFGQPDDFFNAPGLGKKSEVPPKDRLKVSAVFEPAEAQRGGTATLKVTLAPAPGYHTYPTKQADPKADSFVTSIEFPDLKDFTPAKDWQEPKPKLVDEKDLKIKFGIYEEKAILENKMMVAKDATPGDKKIKIKLATQVCDEKGCIPVNETLEVPVTISSAPPVADATAGFPADVAKSNSTDMDLLHFLGQGIFWAIISLMTPCVFPMIPITVSFFLKQSEREHHRPLTTAVVYSATIIVVLTGAGLALIQVIQPFSQHWLTQILLGVLFIVFALSLFGMFEIKLPGFLTNLTTTQEGRGGLIGTVFMALTFTIISFTCVAPFYGSFIALSASASTAADWTKLGLGALVFSTTFASPFFILALFPTLLRSLPKSGSWMNTMKVVMGFLELAAAIKFLRAGERALLHTRTEYLTYDLALGMYVALGLVCGLYLLNVFRMEHDDRIEHLSTPRMLLGLAFLTLSFYLLPGLFKHDGGEPQRPNGKVFEWLEAFLLPDPLPVAPATAAGGGKTENKSTRLAWIGNLEKGLKQARDQKKYVFIDFTGAT
jgi:thiol:disulfide interchange protein DsbD